MKHTLTREFWVYAFPTEGWMDGIPAYTSPIDGVYFQLADSSRMESEGWILFEGPRTAIIEIEIPEDFDITGPRIEALNKQMEVLKDAFYAKRNEILEQISKLQAIESSAA